MISTAVPHPSSFIREEMRERRWSRWELSRRMGGDYGMNKLCIDLYFDLGPEKTNMRLGDMADRFAIAFDVSSAFFRNLESMWLADRERRVRGDDL